MTLSVSIVIPTHDRPESLARTVGSALEQTLAPAEIIIVNDGQPLIDPALADRAQQGGVPLTILRQSHASATATRNRGLTEARGDVVLLIDDDILLPEDYLARLVALYEADPCHAVGGIGGVCEPPARSTLGQRVWACLNLAAGSGCWLPRVRAGRHDCWPRGLAGRLIRPRWLAGGAMSLRSEVAAVARFDEFFSGYAFSEDREFSFRVGRRWLLAVAPRLRVRHEQSPHGRPDMARRGRLYVINSLHTAASADPGAGTCLLVAYDFLGTVVLYTLWGLATGRRGYLAFAAAVVAQLAAEARALGREI